MELVRHMAKLSIHIYCTYTLARGTMCIIIVAKCRLGWCYSELELCNKYDYKRVM